MAVGQYATGVLASIWRRVYTAASPSETVGASLRSIASAFDRSLLAEMLGERGRAYRTVDSWSSRTSQLYRLHAEPAPSELPPDLVLKICPGWTEAAARTTFENGAAMSAALSFAGHLHTLEPLAWSPTPPAVLSPFVPGTELAGLLRAESGMSESRRLELLCRAGELLGCLHPALPPPGESRPSPRSVLCAGDYATYNLRCEEGGGIVYMEPPAWRRAVSRHRDLAWFLSSVRRFTPLASVRTRRMVLDGYRRGLERGAAQRLERPWRWSLIDDLRLSVYLLRRHRGAVRARRRARQRAFVGTSTG
jgi:hypothetical protein